MQAYVSVISDQNNVSIVADASTIPSLSRDLSSRGMALVSVKIEGRFHSTALDDALCIINGLCAKDRDLQLPPAERTLVPIRSNVDGQVVSQGSLHSLALRSILTEVASWHATIAAAIQPLANASVAVLGMADAIPHAIVRSSGCSVTKVSNISSTPFAPSPVSVTPQITDPSNVVPLSPRPLRSNTPL